MSVEENKAVVRRYFEGGVAVLDEVLAEDAVLYEPTMTVRGRDQFRQGMSKAREATPDLDLTINDMIAEADKVLVRWTMRFTHSAEFRGFPPTGRVVTVPGFTLYRLAGGKIVESWTNWDALGLLQEIGAISSPG